MPGLTNWHAASSHERICRMFLSYTRSAHNNRPPSSLNTQQDNVEFAERHTPLPLFLIIVQLRDSAEQEWLASCPESCTFTSKSTRTTQSFCHAEWRAKTRSSVTATFLSQLSSHNCPLYEPQFPSTRSLTSRP